MRPLPERIAIRFQVEQVGNYPPVYDVKLSLAPGKIKKIIRVCWWSMLCGVVGALFPNHVTAVFKKLRIWK